MIFVHLAVIKFDDSRKILYTPWYALISKVRFTKYSVYYTEKFPKLGANHVRKMTDLKHHARVAWIAIFISNDRTTLVWNGSIVYFYLFYSAHRY